MFDTTARPRIFSIPPGADFPAELVRGIISRTAPQPPEALAKVRILVNTRRMARRLTSLFADGQPRLLPRISLLTDLRALVPTADLPPTQEPLRRKLDLARLVTALINANPDIAPRAAVFDLADSLTSLLDEMQGEGVEMSAITSLETGDQSGHWERSLQFLEIVRAYLEESGDSSPGPEAIRRLAVNALGEHWTQTPPNDPIIIAGSTGSRGTTLQLMKLVASLPQGALVLPGFDTDCPDAIWDRLGDEKSSEDHPQFRFANLLKTLNARHTDVDPWQPSATSLRNALISLSLRPAPVTSQWLSDGPALGDLGPPTADMTLIEAAQPRDEAVAIAVAIRDGIERGKSVALITPDRTLGRRVAAALQRWNIVPDDSSGRPLALTAPGRFLRQIGDMMTGSPRSDTLIALLKHPLARTDDRGPHLRATREFELFLRRNSILSPSRADLAAFTDRRPEWLEWIGWIRDLMGRVSEPQEPNLGLILARLVAMAEWISAGPNHPSSGALWDETAGRDTRDALSVLLSAADSAPQVNTAEGIRLIGRVLSAENTRDIEGGRPDVMIWGTLEARVQGADLVILGGLNEGTWPERPAPDPWLSQKMRRQVGLLLPDRQIGLSAHDYQQSVCAREVILSRAKRDAEAQTVPSRWLNRLTNLLAGLPAQTGPDALNAMKERGQRFLDIANMLDIGDSIPPARRPAPAPPANLRPKSLSITDIQRLIRDPYAIYARYVLGLKQLNALRPEPGPAMRGDVFHSIMERFVREYGTNSGKFDVDQFLHIADEVLDALVPWPSTRAHWRGHLTLIADHVVETEAWRRATAIPVGLEVKGKISIADSDFDIRGKADRIDRLQDGRLVIYDYKTGSPPTADAVRHFDRQLLIEAVMAEMGAFTNIPPAEVARVVHVGLGRTPKRNDIELIETDKGDYRTVTIAAELRDLLRQYDSGTRGYVSRRAMEKMRFEGDYDHLARFGEWDETQTAVPEQFR